MLLPADLPSESEVRAQYHRICEHKLFVRSPKLRTLLEKLIDRWLLDGGKNVDETMIGEAMGETRVPEDKEDAENHGFPQTRANLKRLRNALMGYLETKGYLENVVIKLNKGSYAPIIAYNRHLPFASKLDPYCDRLILRVKTIIDTRKFTNLDSLIDCLVNLQDTGSTHPRVRANIAFLLYATAPIFPNFVNIAANRTVEIVEELRAMGAEPWELSFADGCFHASHLHDWFKALGLLQTAVLNSQGEGSYYWWYTALLTTIGSTDQAIEILDGAVRHFARTSVAGRLDLAMLQIIGKRFDDASETLTCLAETGGQFYVVSGYFLLLDEAQDNLDDALQCGRFAYAVCNSVSEDDAPAFWQQCGWDFLFLGMYGLVLGRTGNYREAYSVGSLLLKLHENTANDNEKLIHASQPRCSLLELALPLIGVMAFQPEACKVAVDLLERSAFEQHDPMSMWFHVFPPLRHLHGVPEFEALLKKLNLPATRRP